MKISKKAIEIFKLLYDRVISNSGQSTLTVVCSYKDLAEAVQISPNDALKCLEYLKSKGFLTQSSNKGVHNITAVGIDFIEQDSNLN